MKVVSSESIILKNQDFREKDRLVTFLARDKGRMTGVARGARGLTARNVGSYEPFSRGMIYYTESRSSDLVTIRKCDPIPPYLMLAQSYEKYMVAGYFAELVMLSRTPPEETERLFLLLSDGLKGLAETEKPDMILQLRLDFEIGFLNCLGVLPDWTRCGECGRVLLQRRKGGSPEVLIRSRLVFDPSLGIILCPDCLASRSAGSMEISPGSLAFLVARQGGENRVRPTRDNQRELERMLRAHLIHQLETMPRSLALLPKPGEG